MKTNKQPLENEAFDNFNGTLHDNKGPQRLALSTCKAILHAGEVRYSDEEILAIRDFLYGLAGFTAEQYLLEQENTKTGSGQLNHTIDEKSLFVYPCKHGRAGRKRIQPAAPGRKVAALLPTQQH